MRETEMFFEMNCGNNIAYVFNDVSFFLQTEYKVLFSNDNNCLAKCMKMLYNDKIQLFYITNEFKSFASMLSSLDADGFLIIAANILRSVLEVKNNGFLSCKNIDLSFEHIYVEPSTRKVYLIYLPVNKSIYRDDDVFETELRTGLIKLILGIEALSTAKTMRFMTDLQNATLSIEDILSRMKNTVSTPVKEEPAVGSDKLKLISMNTPERMFLNINKENYIIGRSSESADGIISNNKMIGRAHCRIIKSDSGFLVEDLNSANGTLLNRKKLTPNVPCKVLNGDILRIANIEFKILIE